MAKSCENETNKELYETILNLKDLDQCIRFFKDLCSITELNAMEQRFLVAKMLHEGKVYTEICEQTHASSATISRVNRALNYGENALREVFVNQDEKGVDDNEQLMLGNAAAARGLYEAGCAVVSSYPGTPSTEITEGSGEI